MVLDLNVVRDNYNAFARALPDTRVYYAVKANPAPEVLKLLAGLGVRQKLADGCDLTQRGLGDEIGRAHV